MNILGINWGAHDSAAALVQDGRLIAAAEEERFNRIKHAPFAFPASAARFCLAVGGITAADVDVVAYSFSARVAAGRSLGRALRYFPKANFVVAAETGVPVLLNTSFNVKGEPIVCTPREAIACFYNSGLDALILDRFLVRKP